MFFKKHKLHNQQELAMQKNKLLNVLTTQEQELELTEDLTDAQGSNIVGGNSDKRARRGSSASGSYAR